jgi:hypothetical protein
MTTASAGYDPFDFRSCACPACGCHAAAPFFDGGKRPLATLAWPSSREEALNMERLPLDFVLCVSCGHIFNSQFKYDDVPYSDKPNLMFNKGKLWAEFIQGIQGNIMSFLPQNPVVAEIGYGDGGFLSSLARARPAGRYVGFDPHGAISDSNLIELRQELFDPVQHLVKLRPDILISRHVLEHIANPLGFLQKISCVAAAMRISVLAYFEVPCIDRVLTTSRTTDFYYEHSSQFTTESFTRMLESSFSEVAQIGHGYDGEVIYGFVKMGARSPARLRHTEEAHNFQISTGRSADTITQQLDEIHQSGKRVVIWGGTGKGAAFINHYQVDADRFPNVVDSDADKTGTFVPGTGQEIQSRDWLQANAVDVVIVPTQWRARDITAEIEEMGLTVDSILIEHNCRLVDYYAEQHPYRAAAS